MTPWEVERMATPIPPRMLGILSFPTYTRRPGLETRTRPEMIFSLPGPYLRYTRSVPCFLSSMRRKFLMKPSSLRISVMRTLSLEAGMSTFSCSARLALRMRVRRSAIGSLIDMSGSSPARLDHPGHLALEGELPEAEPAELELSDEAARAPAQLAAVVHARLELGGLVQALRLHDERGLGHALGLPEGNAQVGEERLGFLVGVGRGDHDHVHAAHLVHLVEHDLREDHLLLEPEGVVPAAVEGLGGHALEVAHAGEGDVDEAIEELVHARPAQRHLAADGRVLTQLEVGDGLLGPRHHRLLSRDGEEVRHREVEDLGILLALAHAHVEHDLLEARHLEGVGVAPLLHHGGDYRRPEPVAQPRGDIARHPRARRGRRGCGGRRRSALGGSTCTAAARLTLAPALRSLAALRSLRLFRLRIHQHHVRQVDRPLALDDAALPELLSRALVLLDHVDVLDEHAPLVSEYAQDLAALALLLARHHDDRVALPHVCVCHAVLRSLPERER